MSDYNLDPKAAAAADVVYSKVEVTGKYLGQITRAEPVTSKNNAKGVDLSFKSDSGETADYLTIWTHGKDGKQLQGFNTLMALMTCLRTKTLTAENGEIEKYDKDQSKRVKVVTPLFKELMGKPVGLLLQMEEYAKNAGGTAWKPSIAGVFNTEGFTASEVLNKSTKAETLDKMAAALKDKPLKPGNAKPAAHDDSGFTQSENPAHGMTDNFSDDIPFREPCLHYNLWRVI